MSDITENILDAAKTVAQNEVSKVSYDKTIICEVIVADTDNNDYWVEGQGVRMKAKAADPSKKYSEKNKVYVLIPNGDYEQTKLIIGGYSPEDNKKTVVLDQDKYVKDFNFINTSWENGLSWSDEANKVATTTILKKSITKLPYEQEYKYMGVELSIDSSALFNAEVVEGEYSIKIDFQNETNETIGVITIKSTELSGGNPYALIKEFSQFKLFDGGFNVTKIEENKKTKEEELAKLVKEDFADEETYNDEKQRITEFYDNIEKTLREEASRVIDADHIIITLERTTFTKLDGEENKKALPKLYNLTISFGHDISSFRETLQLKLHKGNAKNFSEEDDSGKGIKRNFSLSWKTKDDEGKSLIINQLSPKNKGDYSGSLDYVDNEEKDSEAQQTLPYVVYWLKYDNNAKNNHHLAGLEDAKDIYNWKCFVPGRYVKSFQYFGNIEVTLSPKNTYESYKVIIRKNFLEEQTVVKGNHTTVEKVWRHSFIYSDILIFVNKNKQIVDTNNAPPVVLLKEEERNGIYNIYDDTGNVVDRKMVGPYTLKASFYDQLELAPYLLESIEWLPPDKDKSMIEWVGQEKEIQDSESSQRFEATFNLSSRYDQSKTDNTIHCVITTKTGEVRSGSFTCDFGKFDEKTGYAFNLDFKPIETDGVINPHPERIDTSKRDENGNIDFQIIPRFTDASGKTIEPTSWDLTIVKQGSSGSSDEPEPTYFTIISARDKVNNDEFLPNLTQDQIAFQCAKNETSVSATDQHEYSGSLNDLEFNIRYSNIECAVENNHESLQATLNFKVKGQEEDAEPYIISTFFTIPLTTDSKYKVAAGPNKLVYTSEGKLQVSSGGYELYDNEDTLIENMFDNQDGKGSVTWKILTPIEDTNLYPQLKVTSNRYTITEPTTVPTVSEHRDVSINAYINQTCVWSEPIKFIVVENPLEDKYTNVIYFKDAEPVQQTYSLRKRVVQETEPNLNGYIKNPMFTSSPILVKEEKEGQTVTKPYTGTVIGSIGIDKKVNGVEKIDEELGTTENSTTKTNEQKGVFCFENGIKTFELGENGRFVLGEEGEVQLCYEPNTDIPPENEPSVGNILVKYQDPYNKTKIHTMGLQKIAYYCQNPAFFHVQGGKTPASLQGPSYPLCRVVDKTENYPHQLNPAYYYNKEKYYNPLGSIALELQIFYDFLVQKYGVEFTEYINNQMNNRYPEDYETNEIYQDDRNAGL